MSYSRWFQSVWYAFHHSDSPPRDIRRQILAFCFPFDWKDGKYRENTIRFTYKDIKDDWNGVVRKCLDTLQKGLGLSARRYEVVQLKLILKTFVEDMEEDFTGIQAPKRPRFNAQFMKYLRDDNAVTLYDIRKKYRYRKGKLYEL